MQPSLIPATSPQYRPEKIWQARRAFFDDGTAPEGLIDEPVLRSWRRCRGQGRQASESVAFDPVERGALLRLLEGQHALLEAARPALMELAGAVGDAGYAVLLTDAQGRALCVDGDLGRRSRPLRQAFRPGVDLSELVIGTNAMSSAIAEQRSVRVLGPEHFFADNQIFHCCAAPVFDPLGRVMGAVDVSRDTPGQAIGALALTQRCARRIERQLFDALPAFTRLALETPDSAEGEAWLAFDRDAVLIAATPAALHLLDLPLVPAGAGFDDLFDERFAAVLEAGRRNVAQVLRLRGGVRLRARVSQAATPLRSAALSTGPFTGPYTDPSTGPHAGRFTGRSSDPSTPRPTRPSTRDSARADARSPMRPVFGDPALAAGFERALRAFEADLPVLVTGETGVGKEVAARALHEASERRDRPFVALNCGAIAPQLMAAELFGHVEGAYTGARRGGSAGKIEAAQGGSLLLDEIGDMPLELQVGLLRVLDSGEVVRVGATQPLRADVRFVCATHRDLRALVSEGRFREDLYYRISGFTLQLPPLHARSDFDAVLDALLAQQACPPQRLGSQLRRALKARRWPGNVRQLRNALRLALALTDGSEPLLPAHFPAEEAAAPAWPGLKAGEHAPTLNWRQTQDETIALALKRTGGNVTAAAALLGMGRATLYRKLDRKDER